MRWMHQYVANRNVFRDCYLRHDVFARVCLSVCLSVSKINQKRVHGFGWNVACQQLYGTWTNWLTFEPDPDYSPDAGTGLLSPRYRIGADTPNFTSGKSHVCVLARPAAAVTRGFKWFYSLNRRNTFVGGTCALPSALLLFSSFLFNFSVCSVW